MMASELWNNDICQTVTRRVCIQVQFGLEMSTWAIAGWLEQKWRGVRLLDCRKKRYVIFTNFICDMCEWRLLSVWNCQYHGLVNLAGNRRNVSMATYGKSMVVFTHQVISVGWTVHWPRLCIEDRYNLCCDISNVVPELQETEQEQEQDVYF